MIHPVGFLTQSNAPALQKNDKVKHNICRFISYIPIVSAIPAIYKLYNAAKICFDKYIKTEIDVDLTFKTMFEAFENDIKSQNQAVGDQNEIDDKLIANINEFSAITAILESYKKNRSFDLKKIETLNQQYKNATSEFYQLIDKPCTPPKKYPIEILIDALKHNERVSIAKNYSYNKLAAIAFRAFVFEIAPIGWTLIPVDLFATYCRKQKPTKSHRL